MKKFLVSISAVLLAVFLSFAVYAANESEPNNSMLQANSISTNGTVYGNISVDGDEDYYKVTLPSSGRLSIKFNSFIEYYSLVLFDDGGSNIWWSDNNQWASTTMMRSDTKTIDLEKGTYYLKVIGRRYWNGSSNYTGNYNFTLSFAASGANVAEPNNSIAEAKSIKFDSTVKGQIAINDRDDYYAVTLPSSGRITFKLNSFMQYYCAVIYDTDGKELWHTDENEWVSTTQKRSDTYTIDLEEGTYYLKVNGYRYRESYPSTGNYNFTVSFKASGANIAEPNNSIAEAKAIKFDSTVKGQIAINDRDDYYAVTLPSAGRITLKFNSFMQYYCAVIYDSDGKELWYTDYNDWVSTTQKRSDTYTIDLEEGTYYLKVNGYRYRESYPSTGNYNFTLSFKASGANIAEPNNSIAEAKRIKFGSTVKGQIAINDKDDYYYFTLSASGTVIIKFNSYMQYYCAVIYDADGKQLWYTDYNEWISSNKSRSDKHSISLSAGTYYLKINGYRYGDWYASTGNYNFTLKQDIYVPKVSRVSAKSSTSSISISWKKVSGVSGYEVQIKSGKKYKTVATASKTKAAVKKLKTGTKYAFRIRAYKVVSGVKYYSGWTTFSAATAPAAPSLKVTPGTKSATLKAGKQAASGFEIYRASSKNGKYKKIATVKGSSLNYKNKSLKSRTTYYYKVRAYVSVNGAKYYGAFSSVKSARAK